MFLVWSSFRFLKIIAPWPKMAPPLGLSVLQRILKKIFLDTNRPFLIRFHINVP